MFTRRQSRIITLVATGLLLLALAAIAGCEVMRTWDKQLAETFNAPPPAGVTTQPGRPVTPPQDPADPYVEITSGILALLGFGGLAKYIHSTKKNGNLAVTDLLKRVLRLEQLRDNER